MTSLDSCYAVPARLSYGDYGRGRRVAEVAFSEVQKQQTGSGD